MPDCADAYSSLAERRESDFRSRDGASSRLFVDRRPVSVLPMACCPTLLELSSRSCLSALFKLASRESSSLDPSLLLSWEVVTVRNGEVL
jgi:hypothetical protein